MQGKVPREFLEKVVFSSLGAKRDEVLSGPGHGLDNSVISLGGRKVLLATSDPLSVIPSVGLKRSAWLSVHLLASDMTTSGVPPQFAMLDFNLPAKMELPEVGVYLRAVGKECERLGISIAGGHTGRYPGSGYTVVGGGTMFAVADKEGYVTPAMAREGDVVLMTKGAGIGASAVLARSFPKTVGRKVGQALLRRARSRIGDCSTVADALAAASTGLRTSVTSMHDATEGGVLGGLFELSLACDAPVFVSEEKIHVSKEAAAVCAAFGLDPLVTLSEGTLLITCRKKAVERVEAALAAVRVPCYQIGRIGAKGSATGLWSASSEKPIDPGRDEYWRAYSESVERGLD